MSARIFFVSSSNLISISGVFNSRDPEFKRLDLTTFITGYNKLRTFKANFYKFTGNDEAGSESC